MTFSFSFKFNHKLFGNILLREKIHSLIIPSNKEVYYQNKPLRCSLLRLFIFLQLFSFIRKAKASLRNFLLPLENQNSYTMEPCK